MFEESDDELTFKIEGVEVTLSTFYILCTFNEIGTIKIYSLQHLEFVL